MEASDEELVAQAKQELPYNTHAFEKLLHRYELRVFKTCRRYLNDEHDAEEASQEVFLRVFHALAKFQGKSTFKTWLFRIAVNTSLTRREKLARRKSRQSSASQFAESELLELVADEMPETLEDMAGPLADAFATLSPDDQEILVLRYVSELQINEICEVRKIKESAVKMRVSRALQRLKDAYQESLGN